MSGLAVGHYSHCLHCGHEAWQHKLGGCRVNTNHDPTGPRGCPCAHYAAPNDWNGDDSRFCEAHQIAAENETCPCCEVVHADDELRQWQTRAQAAEQGESLIAEDNERLETALATLQTAIGALVKKWTADKNEWLPPSVVAAKLTALLPTSPTKETP